ncbi:MAG: sugar phosphate isomerase/epimerase [Planctomycetota bacterium]|nr:sugar phosphate isomerase/epimerase [Planctomycetota bacterium]
MSTSFNRRRFLALTTAAAAGATIFDVPGILAADDPYRGLPIGVQSFSLRNYNVVDAVRHIQGMGLHFVEFYSKHLNPNATAAQLAENRQLLERAKVTLSAHGVNRFSKDHEANRKVFEFAKRAGIRNITANPTPDSFDSLDKLVAEYNIRIAIHNHGPGALYDSIDSVKKAVSGHHKLIGACVDTGHFIRSKEDPVKAVHELGPRVFGVHMKDEEKQEKKSHNVVIGSGHLDVLGLFKALKKVSFPADGSLSLEYEANPSNPIDDMKQCLAVAREAIAKL